MDKEFDKRYSLDLPKIKLGKNEDSFSINQDFSSHFENAPFQNADVQVQAIIQRYTTHLDVNFSLKGSIEVECDRCAEFFPLKISSDFRVIYSHDTEMKFAEDDDIVHVPANAHLISLVQELYDYLCLAIPFRKVHEDSGLSCPPEVMAYILPEEEAISDARWDALKKLKDQN